MARDFDGSDDQINYPNNSQYDITGDFTLMIFFNPDTWNDHRFNGIFVARDTFATLDWELYYDQVGGQNRIRFGYGNGLASGLKNSTFNPSTGSWHNVFITRATNTFVIYGDGQNRGNFTETEAMPTGESITLDQLENGSTGLGMNGKLAYAMILDGLALSVPQMDAINRGANPLIFSTGLAGNLAFFAPVLGINDPEPNYAGNTTDGDVTGATKATTNPPVELLENYL